MRPVLGALFTAALAALIAAGCGGRSAAPPTTTVPTRPSATPAPSPTATTRPVPTISVLVYFLREGRVAAARRTVPETNAVATAAMRALLAGTTGEERAAG